MPIKLFKRSKASQTQAAIDSQPIQPSDTWAFDSGITISTLLGSSAKPARSRTQIYEKWQQMESDPFVSAALRLHVTAALAGDPETGDAVYFESRNGFDDKESKAFVDELRDVISPLINESASALAHNGLAFGDAFSRVYSGKNGVHHLLTDELVRTPLIQPFERGGKTVGYVAYSGDKPVERLTMRQMARLKMPRGVWIPQNDVVEKSYRTAITEDDLDQLPVLPSMVGGSILYQAESAFDDLRKSLLGLVGQRWVDSLDEQILALNMESMSEDQQKRFAKSIGDMLGRSKKLAEQAVNSHTPILVRTRHLIPVNGEKGMPSIIGNPAGSGRTASMTVEDVMFHAKSLTGSLGMDLSLLGFSDLLSGGLGDGGFFRTSAQVAEASAMVKRALSGFIQQVIDIHTYTKYGKIYQPHERPWKVVFYGTISALENEKQNTRLQAMNAGSMLGASIQQLKDMGFNEKQLKHYLTKQMLLDEEEAEIYAAVASVGGDAEAELSGDLESGEQPTPNSMADLKKRFSKAKHEYPQ